MTLVAAADIGDMGLWSGLVAQRKTPRWLRRTFAWGGALLAAVLVGAVIGGFILAGTATREAREATWLPSVRPPAGFTVCTSGPSAECVREAADRVGVPVASIIPPGGFRLQWLVATPRSWLEQDPSRSFAYEEMASADVVLELTTRPQYELRADEGERVTDVQTPRGWAVRVLETQIGPRTLTLEWARYGITYRLFVAPIHFFGDDVPVTDELLRLVDGIQYTQPTI